MCRVKFPKRQNSIETQALLLQSFLGKYDKPPTCKVSHWPFIPTGGLFGFLLNQKRYCKHWEGGEAYEIPRLPDGS